jgi:predicted N-acyltransferase
VGTAGHGEGELNPQAERALSLLQTLQADSAVLAPAPVVAPRVATSALRLQIFDSLAGVDRAAWDEVAGTSAVIRSYDYLSAIAAAGINDCQYFFPVVYDDSGRILAHCCVYTITTDLLQILPESLQGAARLLRRLWPAFLQVKLTECASPHVIGHAFSFRRGEPRAALLLLLESAIAQIATQAGSPLIVIRDFLEEDVGDFEVLSSRSYQRVCNQPQSRIPLRWASYAHYIASMRSRYRKDLGRRLRRAEALGQQVGVEVDFGTRAQDCAQQVRLAYERSQGIKREVLGADYFARLNAMPGASSALLVATREGQMVGHGMVLADDTQLVATYFGRSAGPPDDIWFQLLDAAIRLGYERGLKYLNLGLGSYEAKSLMGAELHRQYCYSRSRYRWVNWLMRKVPRAMEPALPQVHRIFHDEA